MFRYKEDKIIEELNNYIMSTYKGHYAGTNPINKQDIQTIDIWKQLDIEKESCHSNIIKYIMRYGKKDGYNKKDLLKIMHYTILLWYFTQPDQNCDTAK